jgi:Xaa-Pro aminopeptidase
MYAASEHEADLLYATRFFVPDPFLWWSQRGRTAAVLSPLEVDRARRTAAVDQIYAIEDYLPKTATRRGAADLILAVAQRHRFGRITVPAAFPTGLAQQLQKRGLTVTAAEGSFFPERECKTATEIKALTQALRLAEAGMARAFEVLRASRPGAHRHLRWGSRPLTSEILRGEIDAAIIKQGGLPAGTIVAGGAQACDPHERGFGPLSAHQAIILDIFPRDQKTGYFGDLTRTVVRGRAPEKLREMYAVVADGKAWILRQMQAGADGLALEKQLLKKFEQAGFPTEQRHGRWVGLFHGVGHGLGLEIHEAPRFRAGRFKPGQVITVEPGLYYPEIGGVRLEDVAVIRGRGVSNLTRVEQKLEL